MPPPLRSSRQDAGIALALFAAALAVRFAAVHHWAFDGLYGQDAFAYFDRAMDLAQTGPAALFAPTAFLWPWGYPASAALLIAAGSGWAGGAQALNLLAGALFPVLIYLIARSLFSNEGRFAGMAAAAPALIAAQPVLYATLVMTDMTALFWSATAVWCAVRIAGSEHPVRWLFGCGTAAGLAVSTRWASGLVVVVPALYALYLWRKRRLPLGWLGAAMLPAMLLVAPQIWNSLHQSGGLLQGSFSGWSLLNGFRRTFVNDQGVFESTLHYRFPNALFYLLCAFHPSYLLPPLTLCALPGLYAAWRSRRATFWLLTGMALLAYVFLSGMPYQNFRFGLALYLPLLLLSGFGLEVLRRRFGRRAAYGLLLASLAVMAYGSHRTLDRFYTTQTAIKGCARELAAEVPAGAPLFSFWLTATLKHYTPHEPVEFFATTMSDVQQAVREAGAAYLVADPENLRTQWGNHTMQQTLEALQSSGAVMPLRTCTNFTLFKIENPKSKASFF